MNSVNLTGRLTADPDLRYDGNGRPTALVRLAVSDRRNADSGIVFIDVVAFGARAQTAAHHLRKGRLIAVEGRLVQNEGANQHRRWQKHQVHASSIDFLDAPSVPSNNGSHALDKGAERGRQQTSALSRRSGTRPVDRTLKAL